MYISAHATLTERPRREKQKHQEDQLQRLDAVQPRVAAATTEQHAIHATESDDGCGGCTQSAGYARVEHLSEQHNKLRNWHRRAGGLIPPINSAAIQIKHRAVHAKHAKQNKLQGVQGLALVEVKLA